MHISNTGTGNLQRPVTRVFMWGMMGVGKTTWGKKLASRLGWQHIDLDARVENRLRMTVGDIFRQMGESAFREAEACELDEVIKCGNVVVSTGGGAPCHRDGAAKMLDSGLCIWLDAPVALIADRIKQSRDERPLLQPGENAGSVADTLHKLSEQRASCYGMAHWRIPVASLNIGNLALEVSAVIQAQ